MLRFFRNIRQHLLTQNRFSKYLLYAVGEILLVVFGILIALKIDNWNERNKEITSLVSTLKSTNNYLTTEISEAEMQVSTLNNWIQNLEVAIAIIISVDEPNAEQRTILENAFNDIFKTGLRTYNMDVLNKLSSRVSDSKVESGLEISISQLIQDIEAEKWISNEVLVPNLLNYRHSLDSNVLSRNLDRDFIYDFELMKTNRKFHEYITYSQLAKQQMYNRKVDIITSYNSLNKQIVDLIVQLEK